MRLTVRPRDKKQHSIELICRIMRFFELAPIIVLLKPTGNYIKTVGFCMLAPAGPSRRDSLGESYFNLIPHVGDASPTSLPLR